MDRLVETLQQHFRQNSPNYGDAETVVDMLYAHYTEHGSVDSEKVVNQFATLRKLVNLPPKEYDQVFYAVSDLCIEHSRLAFTEGLRMGMDLVMEVFFSKEAAGNESGALHLDTERICLQRAAGRQ